MRNFSRMLLYVSLAITLITLLACGGGKGDGGGGYDGVYSCGYSRVYGTVFFTIDGQTAYVNVFDNGVTYSGTSTVSSNGSFVAILHATGQPDITVSVTSNGSDMQGHRQFTVNITGGFTVSNLNATYDAGSSGELLAGTYTGTFTDGATTTGPFTMIVSTDGTVVFKPNVNGTEYTGNSTLSGFDSNFDIQITGLGSGAFQAHFVPGFGTPKLVSGTWQINGGVPLNGTFSGQTQ